MDAGIDDFLSFFYIKELCIVWELVSELTFSIKLELCGYWMIAEKLGTMMGLILLHTLEEDVSNTI